MVVAVSKASKTRGRQRRRKMTPYERFEHSLLSKIMRASGMTHADFQASVAICLEEPAYLSAMLENIGKGKIKELRINKPLAPGPTLWESPGRADLLGDLDRWMEQLHVTARPPV